MELNPGYRLALDSCDDATIVIGDRDDDLIVVGLDREAVGEVHVLPSSPSIRIDGRLSEMSFQPMCGTLLARTRRTRPERSPSPAPPSSLSP